MKQDPALSPISCQCFSPLPSRNALVLHSLRSILSGSTMLKRNGQNWEGSLAWKDRWGRWAPGLRLPTGVGLINLFKSFIVHLDKNKICSYDIWTFSLWATDNEKVLIIAAIMTGSVCWKDFQVFTTDPSNAGETKITADEETIKAKLYLQSREY